MLDINAIRYEKRESLVHSLDPRVKSIFLLVYIASLFYTNSLIVLLFSSLFLILLYYLAKISLLKAIKEIKRILILFLFFALLIALTEENGSKRALLMIFRLLLSVLSSSLIASTTRPKEIAEGIEKTLGKGILKKPIHILSSIVMIALRFLPLLQSESERIMDAQKSRGCTFEEKGIRNKARALLPLLVPVFVSSFHRADEMAKAMDARGFNKCGSTSLHPLEYNKRDFFGYLIILLYLLVVLLLGKIKWI